MQYSPVQNNIDGQFVDANTSRSLNVVSPLEGNQLSKVPMSTPRNKMEGYRIRTTRMGWIYTGNYRSLSVGSVSSVFLTTLSVVPPAVQDFGSWVTRLYVLVQLVHQENGKTIDEGKQQWQRDKQKLFE